MSSYRTREEPLYVGIDGGGSKCRATLFSPERGQLGTGVAGAANPFQDIDQAYQSMCQAAALALADAGLDAVLGDLVAGVGLAGVNLPRFYEAVSNWRHPFKAMFLTTDLHIACLGAHTGSDGAVIVVGTGSCAYGIVNEVHFSYGGHGFPVGDQGSGAWMGLEAVKAALLAQDKLGPHTVLLERLCQHFGADHLGIIDRLASARSTRFAQLAPLVVAAAGEGDRIATGIIESGADYIAALASRLQDHDAPRIALLGGLGKHLLPWLEGRLGLPLEEPELAPEMGAVHYARTRYHSRALAR